MSKSSAQVKFVIEKGIAIPPRSGRPAIYGNQYAGMAVGDSIVLRDTQVVSFRAAARKLGYRIETRKEGDNTRVWKTAVKIVPKNKKAAAAK